MNFLIVGNGVEERAWAEYLTEHSEHRLWAAFPGFDGGPQVARPSDLDEALAFQGVNAVVVGGDPELRAEALRRAAAVGLPIVCLHPPGADAEPYYQVAMSRAETGAVIVPYMPLRRHPAVAILRRAVEGREVGAFRSLQHESPADPDGGDLTRHAFARMVDVVRALLGDFETLIAMGDPPGERPDQNLVVHLRAADGRRGEVRTWMGAREPARLVALGSEGSLTWEYDPELAGPMRLLTRSSAVGDQVTELDPWDPHEATLAVLTEAMGGREAHPDLADGTRAMELAEAAVQSLRRERTVELHLGAVSEAGNFKSLMTSVGCLLLFGALIALPIALVGPAFGFRWTLYIAYAIPPLLILFFLAQTLRFALRSRRE